MNKRRRTTKKYIFGNSYLQWQLKDIVNKKVIKCGGIKMSIVDFVHEEGYSTDTQIKAMIKYFVPSGIQIENIKFVVEDSSTTTLKKVHDFFAQFMGQTQILGIQILLQKTGKIPDGVCQECIARLCILFLRARFMDVIHVQEINMNQSTARWILGDLPGVVNNCIRCHRHVHKFQHYFAMIKRADTAINIMVKSARKKLEIVVPQKERLFRKTLWVNTSEGLVVKSESQKKTTKRVKRTLEENNIFDGFYDSLINKITGKNKNEIVKGVIQMAKYTYILEKHIQVRTNVHSYLHDPRRAVTSFRCIDDISIGQQQDDSGSEDT